jgi:glycerol-3-phosphate O-acyltransferase
MMLAYYRNSLVHLFVNDAYIACALEAFGETINSSEGVSLQRLWEQTQFISDILRDEFMVRD